MTDIEYAISISYDLFVLRVMVEGVNRRTDNTMAKSKKTNNDLQKHNTEN
jgi:hypothetical protein